MHLFSNGGAFCLATIYKAFEEKEKQHMKIVNWIKQNLSAIIFDSAPCYMHRDVSAHALSLGLAAGNEWHQNVIQYTYKKVMSVVDMFVSQNDVQLFWHLMTYHPMWCPEYYVFSMADPLLDAKMLEELIERRRAHCSSDPKKVRSTKVDDAKHVMIVKSYPDLYFGIMQSVNEWGVNHWRKEQNCHSLPPWSFSLTLKTASRSKL